MSKNTHDQNNSNEEVDLLVLFNYIGDKINKLVGLIISFIKSIYSVFIYAAKAVINNLKIILAVVVISAIAGYFLEENRDEVYESGMLVRTHFGSKYQLATNIKYYNALIDSEDYETLSNIFEIHKDTIAKVSKFEMEIGPETENERVKDYVEFLRSLDSVRAQQISFEEYVENRSDYSGNLFTIRVESTKQDIFKSLETGINKSFDNLYSIDEMLKRDSLIVLKRGNIERSIRQIDSLKKVYINVIEKESEMSPTGNFNLRDGFPLLQEKSETKEFQLLNKELELRNSLRALEEEKLQLNKFFDVISSFQVVGNKINKWYYRYTLLLPILGFLLLCLVYLGNKFAKYVKNYEA